MARRQRRIVVGEGAHSVLSFPPRPTDYYYYHLYLCYMGSPPHRRTHATPPLNILLTGVHWGWLGETLFGLIPHERERAAGVQPRTSSAPRRIRGSALRRGGKCQSALARPLRAIRRPGEGKSDEARGRGRAAKTRRGENAHGAARAPARAQPLAGLRAEVARQQALLRVRVALGHRVGLVEAKHAEGGRGGGEAAQRGAAAVADAHARGDVKAAQRGACARRGAAVMRAEGIQGGRHGRRRRRQRAAAAGEGGAGGAGGAGARARRLAARPLQLEASTTAVASERWRHCETSKDSSCVARGQ